MIPLQVHCSSRIKPRHAGIMVLCFCAVWLVPVGYGQADRVSQLIADLKDARWDVRKNAAMALGQIKDPRAVEPLIAALKDPEAWVEWSATAALGKIGAPAVEPLIALLNGSDEDIRRNAAASHRGHRAKSGAPGSDVDIRRNAARALEETKDPRAVEALLAAWKEPDLGVIAGAYSFFIKRGETGSEGTLIQALNAYGNYAMAVDLLNCGNSALEAAASEWAGKHGYRVTSGGGSGGPRWGSGQ